MNLSRALLLTLVLLLSFSPFAEARKHRKFKGVIIVNQILKLDGTISNNGKQALEYSAVKQNDLLETGDNSHAVIRIPGLAIFKMGPNTRFRLTSFSDRNESRFEIEKGTVLSLFRRPGHHVVKTPHGVLTLHGTTFLVKTDPSLEFDEICLCDGKISAQSKVEKRKTASDTAATPAKAMTPAATLPSATLIAEPTATPGNGAVISAEPTAKPSGSGGASGTTGATSTGTGSTTASPAVMVPSPTQPPPKELDVTSNNEHKQFEMSAEGIILKDLKLLDLHSNREIQELDSLYDLP